ncbi:MAG: PEPxxWA-CTERM sorting domain-containing protein [Sphingomonas sp.]
MCGATAANAQTIQNFDSGWYQNNGFTAGVSNINVGSSNLSGAIYNNYLAFNLAGLANQNITSATLTFYGGNGVNTSLTSETLGLFDYKGSINALLSDQSSVGVFTDLGNGNSYGTAVVAAGPIQQFSIVLSAAAIADLNFAAHNNPADTRFVIGGSLSSISGPFANEQLFAIFGPQTALTPAAALNLATVAVPEPTSWAMLLTGFGLMGFAIRRRKATARIRFA